MKKLIALFKDEEGATAVEYGIMIGAFSLFFFLFCLFIKHMPSISMTEVKEMLE